MMAVNGNNRAVCPKRTSLRSFLIALLVFLMWAAAGKQAAYGYPSNNVPLDNWAYEGLDKLAGFGLIHSDVEGMRPYTRMEVARLVAEALDTEKKKKLKLPSLIKYFLDKFQCEYKEELTQTPATLTIKPLDEAKLDYVYSDGQPEHFLNTNKISQYPANTANQIVGYAGTPLLPNNQGVVYGKGNNLSFEFASSFQLWGLFSGYVEPLFLARQNASPGMVTGGAPAIVGSYSSSEIDLLTGYLKFSPLDSFEIEIGRDSMWWGQGYTGTLLLTDNAPPLDMVKISNPVAIILPGLFNYLGPFKYSLFWARLEADRDHPHAQYGGVRIDFKPTPNLELGMARTYQFGGQGSGSPGTFFQWLKDTSFYSIGGTNNNPDNFEAEFDWRYRMPCLWDAQFYGEWGGEDTGFKPRFRELFWQDTGYILGLYFPRITSDGRTDLRIEYTDNVNEYWLGSVNYDFWYGHGTYKSGMTYKGLILGDPMGPDARQGYVRVSRYVRNDLKVGLDGAYGQRGANMGRCVSGELVVGVDATYDINAELTAMVRYSWGDFRNFDLIPGDNQTDNLLMIQMKYNF
jgi:hypothetical protein